MSAISSGTLTLADMQRLYQSLPDANQALDPNIYMGSASSTIGTLTIDSESLGAPPTMKLEIGKKYSLIIPATAYQNSDRTRRLLDKVREVEVGSNNRDQILYPSPTSSTILSRPDVFMEVVGKSGDDYGVSIVKANDKVGKSFVFTMPTNATPEWFVEYVPSITKKKGVDFDSVIIEQDKVEQVKEAIAQQQHKELIFTQWGFQDVFEKGTAISLLFYGIPGTGKTLMAQAIADHLKMELKIIGAADIQTSEPGGAERRIKGVFEQAGEKTIILLDECDSLLMDRNSVGHIMASQINTLLSAIEQFKGIVIFTTNRLGRLDTALERRITAKIQFMFPKKDARKKIWERMLPPKAPLADDVDLGALAEFPLTGGNIKNCVLNAARKAAYKNLGKIDQSCFIDAIDKEIEAMQEFESNRVNSYKQGNLLATRDHDIVQSAERLELVEKVSNAS